MLLYDIQLRNPNRAVHIRFDGIGARGASLDSREYRVVNTECINTNHPSRFSCTPCRIAPRDRFYPDTRGLEHEFSLLCLHTRDIETLA